MENLRNGIFRFSFHDFYFSALKQFWVLFIFFAAAAAQDLPKEIRGYKIYRAEVSVKNQNDEASKKTDAFVKIGEPKIVDFSLTGVTVEISAEIIASQQSGTIDFVTFKDFRINNLAVSIEEYRDSFSFKKNQTIALPKPVKISLGVSDILRGAVKEIKNAEDEWTVTGTVFVFGRFKKFGFNFKRVIPVEINLKIKNPIKSEQ